ncbi:MAG: hypothetical protein M0P12_00970 [Paludibacteraceae bacterium]|nr:hypothetical protein [Paludibacteraceae bacterium]
MQTIIKTREIDHSQLTNPSRLYWEPGKRDVDSDIREGNIYRNFHIPSPNPVAETLSRNGYGNIHVCIDNGTGVSTAQSIPAPVITKTSTITIVETGVQGTHVLKETELINVNDVAKTAGGWAFEEEP